MTASLYNGPDLTRCWVAYADQDWSEQSPHSSNVVLIDRKTGCVLYAGNAHDEE